MRESNVNQSCSLSAAVSHQYWPVPAKGMTLCCLVLDQICRVPE